MLYPNLNYFDKFHDKKRSKTQVSRTKNRMVVASSYQSSPAATSISRKSSKNRMVLASSDQEKRLGNKSSLYTCQQTLITKQGWQLSYQVVAGRPVTF